MTPRKIAHLELYDWTFTTWEVMMALNSFEQSPARQAVAAAWMQSMPAEELDRKHADGLVAACVDRFRIEFPLAALNDVIEWFTAQTKQVEERRVDVVSRSTSTESDAPKN
jgi:hypothetical protein